jgi:antitoxin ParD1/3/4
MSKMTKVSLALTQEMTDIVEQAVASGAYATTSEVISEALHQWTHHRALDLQEPEDLRRLWAEGLESGPGRFDGIDGIRQEARRRQAGGTVPPTAASR